MNAVPNLTIWLLELQCLAKYPEVVFQLTEQTLCTGEYKALHVCIHVYISQMNGNGIESEQRVVFDPHRNRHKG